ncbi:MAG: beta/gamma crystallin family protein [bacterium]|nr:beta/gamma crystallin family protein [bacterium]
MKIKSTYRIMMILLLGICLLGGSYGYGQYENDSWNDDEYHDDGYDDRYDNREDGPGVILYRHANFRGSKVFIPAGKNIRNLRDRGWNDKVSSIELVDGARLEIYEHRNYRGAYTKVRRDIHDLAQFRQGIEGNWNDKISSIKVISGRGSRRYNDDYRDDRRDDDDDYATFHRHADGRGSSFNGKMGRNRKIKKRWNDKVSSIWVKRGYRVILYEHKKFRGRRLVLEGKGRRRRGGTLYNLIDYRFNDRMSSYKLERSSYRYRNRR